MACRRACVAAAARRADSPSTADDSRWASDSRKPTSSARPHAALEAIRAEDAVALGGAADRDDGREVDAVLAQDLRHGGLVRAAAEDRRAGDERAGAHRRARHRDRGVDDVDRAGDRPADEPAVALLGDQGAVDPERLDGDRRGAHEQLLERHLRQRQAAEVEHRLPVLGLDLGAMTNGGVGPVADDEDAEHAALGLHRALGDLELEPAPVAVQAGDPDGGGLVAVQRRVEEARHALRLALGVRREPGEPAAEQVLERVAVHRGEALVRVDDRSLRVEDGDRLGKCSEDRLEIGGGRTVGAHYSIRP